MIRSVFRTIRQEKFTERNCFCVLECQIQRVDGRSCIHAPPGNRVRGLSPVRRESGATRSSSRTCLSSIPEALQEDWELQALCSYPWRCFTGKTAGGFLALASPCYVQSPDAERAAA